MILSEKSATFRDHAPRGLRERFGPYGLDGVHIEIDGLDAALRLGMARAGKPSSIAKLDVADLRQPEATPLASGRQARPALAAELIRQRLLLPLRVAKDDRAQLAPIAAIHAEYLFPHAHCFLEQSIIWAWHQFARTSGQVRLM
jgi:hypothetical protein